MSFNYNSFDAFNESYNKRHETNPPADNTDKIVSKVNNNLLITGGFVIMAVALLIKYKH